MMSAFTDLTTAEVFLMGLNMLGACFAFVVTLLARRRLAAQVGGGAVFLGMLCALTLQAEEGGKQGSSRLRLIPNAAAGDGGRMKVVCGARVPETTPLTRMMEEADQELAKVDKDQLPPAVKVAEAPEKPVPKALPVADDEPVTRMPQNEIPNTSTPFTRQTKAQGAKKEETPLGRYYKLVIAQVERKWRVYLKLRHDDAKVGEVEIVFYVNTMGKVENLRIVNDKKSSTVLTEATMHAIKDAEIPPMPAEVIPLLPRNDTKRLKCEFHAILY